MKTQAVLLFVFVLALSAGCAPNPASLEALTPGTAVPADQSVPSEATATFTAAPTSTKTPRPASTITASSTPMTPTNSLQPELLGLPQVGQAKADLARRLSVSQDDIEVIAVEAVVWPDGSLGCPQPGMAYTQVLVEGMRVQLRHGGQVYNYHSGGTERPFLCEQPAPGAKDSPMGTPIFGDDMLTPPEPDY